ncbi:MAG: SpoIIE family protein phosphatase [Deltaproteobacteria bacterium]|nr:SpoIIE family protein phosphatase [Deltaproteobacteria bacterium]
MPIELDNLKESNEFLNLILENIDSAILIADENMRIHQFNKSFLSLFDRAADRVLESSFGLVSGCVNAVKENKPCGGTSMCQFCVLRKTLLQTLVEDYPVDRKSLERVFYIKGKPVLKYLEVTSRLIRFQGQKMILVIIYDVSQIEEQKRKLEKQQQQINHELETAGEIQKSLLPDRDLEIDNIMIAWRFEPSGHVGGDIFQIHKINEEQIGIYMLDVCGHGVSAALVAVTISQYLMSLHNYMRLTGKLFSPEAVMIRLDKEFPMERFDCFFSIAYTTLNIETGRFVYSNAGHMPPLILRSTGHLEILENHGTAIGIGFGAVFGQEEKRLNAGDRLILYTDGLIENFGTDGEREGKDRFHACMENFHHLSSKDLVDRVFEDADRQRGGSLPSDDMSLIAVEFTKKIDCEGI